MSFAFAFLIKASFIAAVGLIVSFRSRSAARAATVWRITFASIAFLPLLSFALPALDVAAFDLPHNQLVGPLSSLVVAVWIAGVAIASIRFLADYLAARALARAAVPVDDTRLIAIFNRASQAVVPGRGADLRLTRKLATAALIGWRKPIVLVPESALGWSDDEVLGVLCHELEHLRNNDWVQLIFERVMVSLMWINPLVHLAFRSSSISREMLADEAAVSSVPLGSYAARLIAAAREISSGRGVALSVAFSGRADAETRVRALFDKRRQRSSMSRTKQLFCALAAMPIVMTVSASEPWRCVDAAMVVSTSLCP